MCPDRLDVALFFPRLTVFSGGVERTLKVVEYSDRANLHFTAYISPAVIRDKEVRRRLEALERSGRLALRTIGSNHTSPEQFDAAMIPSEFWIAALRYPKRPFVPDIHVGVEPDAVRTSTEEEPITYDGVYVGRFHPHKGFLDLPLIAARMNQALGRDVKIAVCGSPQFPRHLALFERRVRALGVEKNLVMLRWLSRENLYATIRRSKLLLYPSYVDAFSITVLESLCLGVPVLAYAIDALRMIWAARKGVYLSPVGNPTAFAARYAELERTGALSSIRKETARQVEVLEREFTWERAVKQERAFLESAAS